MKIDLSKLNFDSNTVMNKTTIQFNEEVCNLEFDRAYEHSSSKQKHTILYVSNPYSPEDLNWNGIIEQPDHSVKGDDPTLDKAWRKYNKAELEMQRIIINRAVEGGMLDAKFAENLKWSRKAGCSCGCSPGWRIRDYGKQSVWLTVTSPSKEQEKQLQKQRYASEQEAKTLASLVI